MNLFGKEKPKVNSDEFEILAKKIATLRGDIDELDAKVVKLRDRMHSFEGRYHSDKRKDKGSEEEPEGLNSNHPMFLP